jgi:predicted phosphodiesterase
VLIGIISDLHANLQATKKIFHQLDNELNIDALICAGDLIGYYTRPLEIIDIIQEKKAHVVIGNHDAISVADNFREEIRYFNNIAKKALKWTRKTLGESKEHWDWIKNLPYTKHVELNNKTKFFICHSTPDKPEEWIYYYYFGDLSQDELLSNWLEIYEADVIVLGHTHVPFIFETSDNPPKIVLNPGSVGQPRDNDPRASFMTFETTDREVTHYRINYNIRNVCKELKAEKLPDHLCKRLFVGR